MKKCIFLLDRSGSMSPRKDDTIGGFATFVDEQSSDTSITLYTFSDTLTCEFRDQAPENAKLINYRPYGNTALYDAMGEILNMHENEDDGIFIIMTDGQENSSRKYTKNHVKDLIKRSKLTLVYAGADIDDAIDLGVRTTYHYDGDRTPDMFRMLSQSV